MTAVLILTATAASALLVWFIANSGTRAAGRDAADIDRIKGMLAPARDDIGGVPQRAAKGGPRHLADEVAALSVDYVGAHREDLFALARVMRAPTAEFHLIVDATWTVDERVALAEWRCGSCAPGRDGELLHVSCPGCPCPCVPIKSGLAEDGNR